MPTSRHKPFWSYQLPVGLLLGTAGFVGNYFKLPLFYNVDILFGSIFVVLAIAWLRIPLALSVALVAASCSYLLWNHPWAIIIFFSEALFLLVANRRWPGNLVQFDVIYWIALGMPFVGFFYAGVMGMDLQPVVMVALKQSVNGIFNTALAVLMINAAIILGPRRRQQADETIPGRKVLFLVMVTLFMAPTLLFMIAEIRNKVDLAEKSIVKSVDTVSRVSQQGVESWLEEYLHTVEALAEQVGDPQIAPASEMQRVVESVHHSNRLLLRAGVLDRNGRTVAYSPLVDDMGHSTLGLDFSARAYVQAIRQNGKAVISTVLSDAIDDPQPIVVIAAPIMRGGELRGFAGGAIDLDQFSALAEKYFQFVSTSHPGPKWVTGTIVDQDGRVVASTSPSWSPLDSYRDAPMELYRTYPDDTVQLLPQSEKNISHMSRWKKSRFIKKVSVGEGLPWTIVVEASLDPFLADLNRESIQILLKIWLILILAIIGSTWLSRYVVHSLDQLAFSTRSLPEKIAQGSLPDFPKSRIRELNRLGDNFQELSIALLEAFGKQQADNEILELHVAERTRQLENEIGERLQVEKQLKASEFRWKFALEGAGEGVWDWDMLADHVYFSPRWWEMLGYEKNDIGHTPEEWRSRLHPDDLAGTLRAFQDYLAGHCPEYAVEFRFRCKDGSWKWILARGLIVSRDAYGRPERIIGTHTDISERKQAEAELADSRAFLKMIIDRIIDPIFVKDSHSRWVLVNEAFCSFVGQSRKDLLGKTDSDFFPPHEARVFLAKDLQLLKDGQQSVNQEELTDSAGATHVIVTKKNLHVDIAGNKFIIGIIRDVTEDYQTARELMVAKEQAISATRAKSAFLANMSHEIRTPLNAILGFSQLLMHDPSLTLQQAGRLSIIHRNGVHLLELINDILEMARIEAGSVVMVEVNFDLHEMFEEINRTFQVAASEKSLSLAVEFPEEMPRWVRGDVKKLRQVLVNLIGNAVKFTQIGGVTVRVCGETEPFGYRLRVEVEDSGRGIPREQMAKLFTPFGRGADVENFEGTGLGLSISRELVHWMGGEILVESVDGKGSLFRFDVLLGLVDSGVPAAPSTELLPVGKLLPGQPVYRILAVDDAEDARDLMLQVLEGAGFEVRTARDGADAIEQARLWQPQLILMDRNMPVLDGVEAIRRIRTADPGGAVKIISVSSSAFAADRQEILAAGADDFLSKPFLIGELLQKIAGLLGVQYEPVTAPANAPAVPHDPRMFRPTVTHLPADLLQQMHDFLAAADLDRLLESIDQVALIDPALASHLRTLTVGYKYQSLFDIISGETHDDTKFRSPPSQHPDR